MKIFYLFRYICRLLSFSYEHDPVTSTQIDNWLEIAHSLLIHGNNKDRQGALRSLNSHLGKSNFLVGDSISLADIITWSAIIQTNLYQSLPGNVTKWFKSLLSADIFTSCEKLIDM
ncbi:Aminoacyl tRNA synthase complex-interacting multifunctional protein 2, partial [Stegodyphus mimosarum]